MAMVEVVGQASQQVRRSLVGLASRRTLVLGLLFLAALGLRLDGITSPPLNFEPTREYHAAVIARAYYLDGLEEAPTWKKRLADTVARREEYIEPRVIEHLASLTYRLAGGERLWIPKLISALFWLVGGVLLYRLAKLMMSTRAATASLTLYLFWPYAVFAS